MLTITCQFCHKEVQTERKTRKYCSDLCASRARTGFPKERTCNQCGKTFQVLTRGDANRQYCTQKCSKKANSKNVKGWVDEHPGIMKQYNANRVAKNPKTWQEKWQKERLAILELLGGKCVVCGVVNPNWLHVDYIPTTRNKPHRHPRNIAYIRSHKEDFRLLCANHHYELTLTGAIEGMDITQ